MRAARRTRTSGIACRFGIGALAVVVAAAGLTATAAVAGAGPARPAQTGPTGFRFAEGEWEIFLSANLGAQLFRADLNASSASTLHGDGDFKVGHDGDVTGTYTIGGRVAASALGSTGSGQGDFNLAGKDQPVTGTRELVALSGVVNLSGTVHASVAGINVDVPISVDGPIGGSGDAPLRVDWSSCSGAEGDWTPAVKESASAAGLDVSGEGHFQALRFATPDGPEAARFTADAAAFGQDVATFVDQATAGPLDIAGLYALLDRAQALATEIPTLAACSSLPTSELYATFLSGDIRTLIELGLALGVKVPTNVLVALANAGYNSGAIGAASESGSDALETQLRDALGARLDEAIASGDKDTILDIVVASNQFGWSDLASRGGAAL